MGPKSDLWIDYELVVGGRWEVGSCHRGKQSEDAERSSAPDRCRVMLKGDRSLEVEDCRLIG